MSDALDSMVDNPDGINPALDDRCDVTELLIDQCAHCRPAPVSDLFDDPAPPRVAPQIRYVFDAAYSGTCAGCSDRFDAGDAIYPDGTGGYISTVCCGEPTDDELRELR